METKLWFLQDLEEIIAANRSNFGSGPNSWQNLLFFAIHAFFTQKYSQRELILNQMQEIYDQEEPAQSRIGFVLPSKRAKPDTLEFGLIDPANVIKMRPIRYQNARINEQLIILRYLMTFVYSIDPKSEIMQECYFEELQQVFSDWFQEQIIKDAPPDKQKLSPPPKS